MSTIAEVAIGLTVGVIIGLAIVRIMGWDWWSKRNKPKQVFYFHTESGWLVEWNFVSDMLEKMKKFDCEVFAVSKDGKRRKIYP